MTGRRRRASTSSVETVDERRIRWLQESSVVKSLPKSSDKNSWPTFELRDAIVYDREGQGIVSALDVAIRGPFTVRGHLVIEDQAQRSHLIMRVRSPVAIEIRNCTEYSIGETEDDNVPLIWVAGQGGWYEISPAHAYVPIYAKMCEATTMYYRVIDSSQSIDTKKPQKRSSQANRLEDLANIFLKYITHVGDGSTFDEVVERCAEHAVFFVSQFSRDEFLIDWKSTDFYKWFAVEHADVFRQLDKATKNPKKFSRPPSADIGASPAPKDTTPRRGTRSASIEEIDPTQFRSSLQQSRVQESARGRAEDRPKAIVHSQVTPAKPTPVSILPTQPIEPIMDSPGGEENPLASVVAALEQIYDKIGDSKHGLTEGKVLNELYFHYKFPAYKDATVGSHKTPSREVLHYNASALLTALDKKFHNHGIYDSLQELATRPFSPIALKASDFPYRVVPRKLMPRQNKKSEAASPTTAVDQREADTDDTPRPIGKSLKRPGRRPGKKSSLRTVTSSSKRTHAEMESDSDPDSETSSLKRSHFFSDGDGDATMEDPVETSLLSNTDGSFTTPQLEEPVKIVIHAEKIPSTIPKGPYDTWTCEQEECDYVVRGGDAADCQLRIQQHFAEHEEQTKRLKLAVTESSRGHMPIKYACFPQPLMLVEYPSPASTANTQPLPAPIPTTTPRPTTPPSHRTSSPPTVISLLSPSPSQQPTPTISTFPSSPPASSQAPGPPTHQQTIFRNLINQFRRRPQPVSDRISSLTFLQPLAREAQADRGESPARGPPPSTTCFEGGLAALRADQEETDSLTVRGD